MKIEGPFSDNTPLHELILENKTAQALELIKEYKNNQAKAPAVNQVALGNTPLLLALKTGNVDIAAAILDLPNVEVNASDDLGMNALHWACYLRADNLIEKIIPKNPNLKIDSPPTWVLKPVMFSQLKPVDLYRLNLFGTQEDDVFSAKASGPMADQRFVIHNFFIQGRKDNLSVFENKNRDERSATTYQLTMQSLALIPLTNLAFHMDTLCINYCGAQPSRFMKSHHSSTHDPRFKVSYPVTMKVFEHNFYHGQPIFKESRNNKQVNPSIVEKLEALQEPKKKAKPGST